MPLTHLALLIGICLIWAGNFIAAALAIQHFGPFTFTALRFFVVLVLLAPWLRPPPPGQWPSLFACCLGMGALHFGLVFLALARSADISSVVILMQVYVPLTTLLAVIWLGERIGWRTTAGIGLSFCGVLVVGLDPLVLGQIDVLLLILGSALSLAVGTIFMRRLRGVGVFGFQAWNALISVAPLGLIALAVETSTRTLPTGEVPWPAWAALAYSAIGASIIGHGGFYWLIQRHEVNRITPFLLLVPVLAVLLGVLLWGDRPGQRLLLGGTLVILGVLWISLRARYRRRSPARLPPAG